MEYYRWVKMLNSILLIRFGISVNDSFDEEHLRVLFSCGDSPVDIARDLKRKRELTELTPETPLY